MKLRKVLTMFIIIMALVLFCGTKSEASLYLESLDFAAQLNEDGSMDVVETWDIRVSETNTLYKTFNKDSKKYSGLTNFSVKEITGGMNKNFARSNSWEYHLPKNYYFGGTNNDGKYEISWGVSIDSSSRRQYQIEYTVNDAIHKYADCSELYWQFVGSDFEVSANCITGTIKLPENLANKEDIKVWGHTKYLNGEIYVTDLDTVEFKVNNYQSGNFVEARLAMPTYLFGNIKNESNANKLDSIIEEETKWANEANARRKVRDRNFTIIIIAAITFNVIVIVVFFRKIKKSKQILKENPKIKPEQEIEYYRDLPDKTATPLEAVFILKKGYNQMYLSSVFSSTILDLTLKGYLKLEQEGKTIKIELTKKDTNDLQEDEKKVMELLNSASKDNTITMKELEKYIRNHTSKLTSMETQFEKISENEANNKGKFDKSIADKAGIYIAKLTGYIFLLVASFMTTMISIGFTADIVNNKLIDYCLISGLLAIIISIRNIILNSRLIKRFNGFTQKGVNEQEEWKAFKKYMEDFSYLNEKEVPELVLWEKYLVYATAFGIADKVLKQLKVKYPELNNQDTLNNMVLFNAMYNSNGFNTGFINSINASTSRMYSTTYSSGSGGGGGFSGGGGFGGRWWRPEAADKAALEKYLILGYNN